MNDVEKIAQGIEAALFALGRPLSHSELSSMLGTNADGLKAALKWLKENSAGRGAIVVDDGRMVELRAAPDAADMIEKARKEQFARDIGRAGLETLAAVLYMGPLSRSQIDFIRGVNSSQVLRTLAMRGMVRKIPNPKDERSFLYEPTTDLLASLGISRIEEIPEYEAIREKIAALQKTGEEAAAKEQEEKQTDDDEQ